MRGIPALASVPSVSRNRVVLPAKKRHPPSARGGVPDAGTRRPPADCRPRVRGSNVRAITDGGLRPDDSLFDAFVYSSLHGA